MVSIMTTGKPTKAGVVSRVLLADKISLDPTLTWGLPAHVTSATGIDAMVHTIEAFTSKRLKNPLSDLFAKQALSLLASNIVKAVKQGDDVEARGAMLLGSMLAGQAFANAPVAAVHALAYPLGGNYHIPHGLTNALVLPHVLRFNAPCASELYAELAPLIMPDVLLPNDSIKITIQFLSNEVRSDALNIKVFKKNCTSLSNCKVIQSQSDINQELRVAILKKAARLEKEDLAKTKEKNKDVHLPKNF